MTFNSLFEIQDQGRHQETRGEEWLSILFLRFITSIRYASRLDNNHFQFSFWDSRETLWCRGETAWLSILFLRFRNGYRVVDGWGYQDFQFSFWDSYAYMKAKATSQLLSFNSLFEIRELEGRGRVIDVIFLAFNSLFEILHLRRGRQEGHRRPFQFSFWDSNRLLTNTKITWKA